jgi:hypothetical protein
MSPAPPEHNHKFLLQSTCSVQARTYPNPGVFTISESKSKFSPRRGQQMSLWHQGLRRLKHVHKHRIYSASVHTKRRSPFITNIRLRVKWPGYGLADRGTVALFPPRAIDLSLLQSVQTGPVAHPLSCLTCTVSSYPGCKATEPWN